MESLSEQLLEAWLDISAIIRNDRIVNGLTFNETFICNILLRQKKKDDKTYLTAVDLCASTGILKSQMNRCLTSLEEKGLIERIRSEEDKRKIYIKFREENSRLYEEEHQHSLKIPDKLIQRMGKEKIEQTIGLLNEIIDTIKKIRIEGQLEKAEEIAVSSASEENVK